MEVTPLKQIKMTSTQIQNEIKESFSEWGPIDDSHVDNPKHLTILATAAEFIKKANAEGYKCNAACVEFSKYMNNTIDQNNKTWNEVVEHEYLKIGIDVGDLGGIIIYKDIDNNICLDMIKSFKKGNGTIVMNMFLDTIDIMGISAVTVPTDISENPTSRKQVFINTMGLKRWSKEFGWKTSRKTPKLYYAPQK
tara:strand:- start:447 stop:1028 length:582 start_codon:yes stop_codon:yes gene_type:complete